MSLSPLEKAASGALASAIANTLVYPLDLSKTIIQTQVKRKAAPEDPGSDYGFTSVDESVGDSYIKVEKKKVQREVEKKKLQKEVEKRGKGELKYKNTVDVLCKLYAKKGVLGWYHGLFSSVVGSAAQNFSYFYWYSIVRSVYSRISKTAASHKHSTAIELFLGALAAAISQLFTMPIGVITTQQQTDKKHRSLYQLAKEIYSQDGPRGFWRGLSVSLVLCVNPSITYGSYERLKQIFFDGKEFLGPLESFTLGMCAKSLATITTQPLIVSKAMLQKKSGDVKKTKTEKEEHHDEDDIKFNSFVEALSHLWHTERLRGLYKGVAPQLLKGVIVQGMLFMFKDQLDMLFMTLLKLLRARKALTK